MCDSLGIRNHEHKLFPENCLGENYPHCGKGRKALRYLICVKRLPAKFNGDARFGALRSAPICKGAAGGTPQTRSLLYNHTAAVFLLHHRSTAQNLNRSIFNTESVYVVPLVSGLSWYLSFKGKSKHSHHNESHI